MDHMSVAILVMYVYIYQGQEKWKILYLWPISWVRVSANPEGPLSSLTIHLLNGSQAPPISAALPATKWFPPVCKSLLLVRI